MKSLRYSSFVGCTLILWMLALPVFAQTTPCVQGTLCNPLRFSTIEQFIEGVLKGIIMIAIPVIVAFMVWAGFQYVSARGNPGKISAAHKNFYYVIIGTAMILGAWVLATLIGATIRQLLG